MSIKIQDFLISSFSSWSYYVQKKFMCLICPLVDNLLTNINISCERKSHWQDKYLNIFYYFLLCIVWFLLYIYIHIYTCIAMIINFYKILARFIHSILLFLLFLWFIIFFFCNSLYLKTIKSHDKNPNANNLLALCIGKVYLIPFRTTFK